MRRRGRRNSSAHAHGVRRTVASSREQFGSDRRAQPNDHSLADLSEHRLDEIGGEKPRASLAVGHQRKHDGAARACHDRMIARRKLSRNRRNCDIKRPHELELLGREIGHLGYRLDGGHGNTLRRARMQPFVEDARLVAGENRSGRNKAARRKRGGEQTGFMMSSLCQRVLCIRVSQISVPWMR